LASKQLAVPSGLRNDLEAPAFMLRPELGELHRVVSARFPFVRMTGSGSSLFLAFGRDSEEAAMRAQLELGFLRHQGVFLLRTRSERAAPGRAMRMLRGPERSG